MDYLQDELDGNLESLLQGYDWLVIDFGIWEIIRNWDCGRGRNDTTLDRVTLELDMLAMLAAKATKSFHIAWLTTGTQEDMGQKRRQNLDAMNDLVRDWFANQTSPQSNMHLVDWAKQLEPRSNDANRIRGDMKP